MGAVLTLLVQLIVGLTLIGIIAVVLIGIVIGAYLISDVYNEWRDERKGGV